MQDAILMILRKSFPVTFTAPPKGSFDRLFCGRISIACWRKWARKNCVCWMLAVEKGRPQSKWPSVGIRSFMRSFCADDRPRKTGAEAKGVSDNMQFIHCAAQDVASHLETPVDLILFHAVLEWVADPRSVLQTLWSVLRPGGVLSLMFYNAHGLLMHNMVAGNFDYVQAGMPKKKNGRFRQIIHATRRRFICGWKKLVGKLWVRQAFACFMIICARNTSSATAMKHYLN